MNRKCISVLWGVLIASYANFSAATIPAVRIANLALHESSVALADLNQDGITDIIFVSGSAGQGWWVHALDGAANPPYSRELPGYDSTQSWPRPIYYGSGLGAVPTVVVGQVDPFSNELWVLVGGLIGNDSVFAFRPDAHAAPGFPRESTAPPYFNAFAVDDVNNQGFLSIVTADESTILHRFNPIGKLLQAQCVGDPIYSSPALGDVGQKFATTPRRADGVPDEVAAAVGDLDIFPGSARSNGGNDILDPNCRHGHIIRVFDSTGSSRDLRTYPPIDQEFQVGRYAYSSSPAIADLDGDGTQDIVIQARVALNNQLQFFLSAFPPEAPIEMPLPQSAAVRLPAYSSPAIVFIGHYQQLPIHLVYIGSDGGYFHAYAVIGADAATQVISLWTVAAPDGSAVSSSPIVAPLRSSTSLEAVFATLGGHVYVLDAFTGTLYKEFSLGSGTGGRTIVNTPAVAARHPTGSDPTDRKAMIVAGNEQGLFQMILDDWDDFDPQTAQYFWPSFHRNNHRTGALEFNRIFSKGSTGGIATRCSSVSLHDLDGTLLSDGYREQARVSDTQLTERGRSGRYLFELIPPGIYILRYNDDSATDQFIGIAAGHMTRQDYVCL